MQDQINKFKQDLTNTQTGFELFYFSNIFIRVARSSLFVYFYVLPLSLNQSTNRVKRLGPPRRFARRFHQVCPSRRAAFGTHRH